MKKFKKFLSVLCAGSMILTMSVPAFAAKQPVENPEALTVDGTTNLIEAGQLDDGAHYWVLQLSREQTATISNAFAGNSTLRYSIANGTNYSWAGHITAPIADGTGHNGKIAGYPFTAYPDQYVAFGIEGSLPSNMPTINVAFYYENGENSDWKASLAANQVVVFELKYPDQEGEIRVSTSESVSRTADVWFYTALDCPVHDFLREV